jgi:hypothetical protein
MKAAGATRGLAARASGTPAGSAFLSFLFLAAFAWTLLSTTVVQQVLAPSAFPSAAETGLINADSRYFHARAAEMAERIGTEGWGAWELRPDGHAPVGITAGIYAVTGPHPWVILWLNTALHAGAFLLLVIIVDRLAGIGRWSALAALPFLFLPSALAWTAGIGKDGFFILGFHAAALGLLDLLGPSRPRWLSWTRAVCLFAVGIALAWLVRPYSAVMFAILLAAAILVYGIAAVVRPLRSAYAAPAALAGIVSAAAILAVVVDSAGSLVLSPQTAVQFPRPAPFQTAQAAVNACWLRPAWLPAPVDDQFRFLAHARAALYLEAPEAGSSFGVDHAPCSTAEVAAAVPRSLLNALLAPWPNQWWRPGELVLSLSVAIEMILIYVAFAALVLHGHRLTGKPSPSRGESSSLMLPLLVFCLLEIALVAVALPNVGTLMRMRYAPMMLLVGLGLAALIAARQRAQLMKLPPSTL